MQNLWKKNKILPIFAKNLNIFFWVKFLRPILATPVIIQRNFHQILVTFEISNLATSTWVSAGVWCPRLIS